MSWNDPFRGYDAWKTREPDYGPDINDAWEAYLDNETRVPVEACEEGHEDHVIYQAWEVLEQLLDQRANRLQAEGEAAYYESIKELEQ